MEILKYLKDDLLIITNESYKEEILLNLKSMYRLKFMSMKEFIRNLTFSYDERSVYYLMKKYNLNYDVAKMYLENIYHETDIKEEKVEKLKQIRQELDDSNLLIYNKYFKDYLKTVDIIVYNYDVNNYEKSKIQEIEKITKVTYLNDSSIKKEQVVYEFSNIEEEIVYVATQIRKLMEKNVPLSSIKIVNIDDTYINPLKRIFDFFNINIDLNDEYIYSNVLVNKFLIQLKETKDISMALKSLENNLEIYEKVLNICNKYAFVNDVDEYVITCIEEELKTTRLKNLQENIKLVNLDNYFSNNDYVFLMNFNQKSIPKIYKDEDYLSDQIKEQLGIDTSVLLNKLESQKIMNQIARINNIIITYKLKTPYENCYKSKLLENKKFKIEKINNNDKYNYSSIYNKLELAKETDKFIKYNQKSEILDLLSHITSNPEYQTYNNKYNGINKEDLLDYLDNKLLLSYSSIDNYYRCAFRYYVENILKLSKYEETFSMYIGNLFHYILSIAFNENFDFEKEFKNYINNREFDVKEEFFIEKLKKELLFVIDTIKKQNQISHFEKELHEEKIYINKEGNVKITFMGIIDKLKYKEIDGTNYVAIIDYKTGNPKTNLTNTIYGIEMQLPIYLYLAKNNKKIKNAKVMGLYLQKIINKKITKDPNKDYKEMLENNLKLEGYSLNQENILEEFDITYKDSNMIKSLKTSPKGFYSYSKILNEKELDLLEQIVSKKIEEAEKNILSGNFNINPKRIGDNLKGCEYCKYRELCYLKEEDIVNLKEYKDLSFLDNN